MRILRTATTLLSVMAATIAASEDKGQEQVTDHALQHKHVSYPYKESLDVTPLPRNHVFTSFKFELESEPVDSIKNVQYTHYKAFPRSLAPILDHTNTRELHMRFGQGWWNSEQWGQLPDSGESAGGVGIEVWGVIEAKNQEESFKRWSSLVNSLSGLFCASLNFIDSAKTVYPLNSFAPKRDIPLFDSNNTLFLVRASLPAEPVCTENLTPFVKFIPTRGKSGLSTLLDGHRLFESEWHMMSIDIETQCDNDQSCKFSMVQKIDAVVDTARALRRKQSPIPRPTPGNELKCDPSKPIDDFQCFGINQDKEIYYSLSDLFGRTIRGGSLVSEIPSRVCVHVPSEWNVHINVDGENFGTGDNCFDLNGLSEYDIVMSSYDSFKVENPTPAPVSVSRSLTGYGQDRGGLRTVFKNNLDSEVRLMYLETLPWFMRIYLHTLAVAGSEATEDVIRSIHYQPEEDRKRPTHLEFEIIIPPKSDIVVSYSFDKSLLLIAEYPPDANHGFSIEPGVVKILGPVTYELRTSPALLTLPTPDFSMPYNVIIFTATVMSLTFGTIFNLLFKRTVLEEEADLFDEVFGLNSRIKTRVQVLKEKVKSVRTKAIKAVLGTVQAAPAIPTDQVSPAAKVSEVAQSE